MAKPRTVFVCSSCGADAPRWSGQCPSCGEWNTLAPVFRGARARRRPAGHRRRRASGRRRATRDRARDAHGDGLRRVRSRAGRRARAGSVTLIGGEPGIGKSTLLLQCAAALAARPARAVCDRRGIRAAGGRARAAAGRRTAGLGSSRRPRSSASSTPIGRDRRAGPRDRLDPDMSVADVDAAPGAVTQLRESTARLVRHAKSTGTPCCYRARDARRRDRRPARARAHGRHGALLRERFRQPTSA